MIFYPKHYFTLFQILRITDFTVIALVIALLIALVRTHVKHVDTNDCCKIEASLRASILWRFFLLILYAELTTNKFTNI